MGDQTEDPVQLAGGTGDPALQTESLERPRPLTSACQRWDDG